MAKILYPRLPPEGNAGDKMAVIGFSPKHINVLGFAKLFMGH